MHLSADCVFDGTEPPYSIESKVNPLSEYGFLVENLGVAESFADNLDSQEATCQRKKGQRRQKHETC